MPENPACPRTTDALALAYERAEIGVRWNIRRSALEFSTPRKAFDVPDEPMLRAIHNRIGHGVRWTGKNNNMGFDAWLGLTLALVDEHRVDPFIAYLEQLPNWDGVERLDTLLERCFTLANPEEQLKLAAWTMNYLTLGAIQRAYHPGTKLDEIPVITGEGGIGKSTLAAHLLPAEHRRTWFTDQLDLLADDQRKAEALDGRVIVEISEMRGSRRADKNAIKTFLQREDDGAIRRAYARTMPPAPRRCVFIGSADNTESLPDDANLRRFVVVELADGDASELRRILWNEQPQLWAEAKDRYHRGKEARLPEELKAQAHEAASGHRYRANPSFDEAVAEWADQQFDPMTIKEVRAALADADIQTTATRDNEIGDALKLAGWKKQRVQKNGKRATLWQPRHDGTEMFT